MNFGGFHQDCIEHLKEKHSRRKGDVTSLATGLFRG